MSLAEEPLVGGPAARSVRGRSSGGTALVLAGPDESVWRVRLEPFGLQVPSRRAFSLMEVARVADQEVTAPLVLVAGEVEVSPVALLDLLDAPLDRTAALVLDAAATSSRPVDAAHVRVAPHDRRIVSAGTAVHAVTDPTGFVAGVLRVRAADRPAAAAVLREAAASEYASDPGVHPFDLALLALVRSGVRVSAVPLGPHSFRRGALASAGVPGSAWQQRLRGASRGNDGVFSTAVIRPISRRLTGLGLRLGWTPNAVTLVSLLLGLAACAATATGDRWAWVAAALLLQLSLVVDCVDGEIARFTRRYSALGGWLDGVSDRVKEFAMVAAVAWVSTRQGNDLWWLALVVLGLLAIRHVEDFAYASRARALWGPADVRRLPLTAPRDDGPPSARTQPLPPPSTRARAVRVVKQVLHLPIAERYLIMSLALLAHDPAVLLWALGVASAIAFAWTESGRLGSALLRRDGFIPTLPDPRLAALTDLALLPRPTGTRRLQWQAPVLLLAAEVAALLWLTQGAGALAGPAAYAWLVAVCWHHYDTVYRIRETGQGPAPWIGRATLGTEGRVLVLVAMGFLLDDPAVLLLGGAMVLAVAYAAESATGWRAFLRGPAVA